MSDRLEDFESKTVPMCLVCSGDYMTCEHNKGAMWVTESQFEKATRGMVATRRGEMQHVDQEVVNEPSHKHDGGKVRLDLLPFDALTEVAKVAQFGAEKYAPRDWESGRPWYKDFAAMMRHAWAWHRGEDNDQESGYSHMAHAACCALFLLAFVLRGQTQFDDRPQTEARP